MEVNGPATIVMLLDAMYDDNRISKTDYDKLRNYAMRTIEYMRVHHKNQSIKWSDIFVELDRAS